MSVELSFGRIFRTMALAALRGTRSRHQGLLSLLPYVLIPAMSILVAVGLLALLQIAGPMATPWAKAVLTALILYVYGRSMGEAMQAASGGPGAPFGLQHLAPWIELPVPLARVFAAAGLVERMGMLPVQLADFTALAVLNHSLGGSIPLLLAALVAHVLTGWASSCLDGVVSLYLRSRWMEWNKALLIVRLCAVVILPILPLASKSSTPVSLLGGVVALHGARGLLFVHPGGWVFAALAAGSYDERLGFFAVAAAGALALVLVAWTSRVAGRLAAEEPWLALASVAVAGPRAPARLLPLRSGLDRIWNVWPREAEDLLLVAIGIAMCLVLSSVLLGLPRPGVERGLKDFSYWLLAIAGMMPVMHIAVLQQGDGIRCLRYLPIEPRRILSHASHLMACRGMLPCLPALIGIAAWQRLEPGIALVGAAAVAAALMTLGGYIGATYWAAVFDPEMKKGTMTARDMARIWFAYILTAVPAAGLFAGGAAAAMAAWFLVLSLTVFRPYAWARLQWLGDPDGAPRETTLAAECLVALFFAVVGPVLLLGALGLLTLFKAVSSVDPMVVLAVGAQALLLASSLWLMRRHSWRGEAAPPRRPVLARVALAIPLAAFTLGFATLYLQCLEMWGIAPSAGDGMDRWVQGLRDGGWWLPTLVVAAVVAPVSEELFFRGLLVDGLERIWARRWLAAPAAAVTFAAAHAVHAFPLCVGIALIFSAVRARTGSLLTGAVAHGLHNAVLVSLLLLRAPPVVDPGAPREVRIAPVASPSAGPSPRSSASPAPPRPAVRGSRHAAVTWRDFGEAMQARALFDAAALCYRRAYELGLTSPVVRVAGARANYRDGHPDRMAKWLQDTATSCGDALEEGLIEHALTDARGAQITRNSKEAETWRKQRARALATLLAGARPGGGRTDTHAVALAGDLAMGANAFALLPEIARWHGPGYWTARGSIANSLPERSSLIEVQRLRLRRSWSQVLEPDSLRPLERIGMSLLQERPAEVEAQVRAFLAGNPPEGRVPEEGPEPGEDILWLVAGTYLEVWEDRESAIEALEKASKLGSADGARTLEGIRRKDSKGRDQFREGLREFVDLLSQRAGAVLTESLLAEGRLEEARELSERPMSLDRGDQAWHTWVVRACARVPDGPGPFPLGIVTRGAEPFYGASPQRIGWSYLAWRELCDRIATWKPGSGPLPTFEAAELSVVARLVEGGRIADARALLHTSYGKEVESFEALLSVAIGDEERAMQLIERPSLAGHPWGARALAAILRHHELPVPVRMAERAAQPVPGCPLPSLMQAEIRMPTGARALLKSGHPAAALQRLRDPAGAPERDVERHAHMLEPQTLDPGRAMCCRAWRALLDEDPLAVMSGIDLRSALEDAVRERDGELTRRLVENVMLHARSRGFSDWNLASYLLEVGETKRAQELLEKASDQTHPLRNSAIRQASEGRKSDAGRGGTLTALMLALVAGCAVHVGLAWLLGRLEGVA